MCRMKKLIVAVISVLALLTVRPDAFAQNEVGPRIVTDSIAPNGTRYVHYQTSPKVCSRAIDFVITKKNVIEDVKFTGGCSGNTQGVCILVKGMKVQKAIDKLEGVKCGKRPTSCPDQLATALKMIQEKPAK